MEVYVEYVVIDNYIIDLLILNLVIKTANIQNNKIKHISAVFGAIIALFSPLIVGIMQIVLKLLCSTIMVYFLCYKSLNKYFYCLFLFFVFTIGFGGACYLFCNLFGITFCNIVDGNIVYNYPVGLAVVICYICYRLLRNLINKFFTQKMLQKFTYKVTLIDGKNTRECLAYLDSANVAKDDKNCGIIIINFDVFCSLFPNVNIENILLKKDIQELKNQKYMQISSISQKQQLLSFTLDEIRIYSQEIVNIHNITCALTFSKLEKSLGCSCLLSPLLLKENINGI